MKKKGLKHNVQNKIILKTVNKNKRDVVFPNLKSVREIGIVCNDGDLDGFDFNSNQLTKNSKLFFLTEKNEKRAKGVVDANIYLSDLNFWGLPIKRKIESFISEPFDILINLSDETNRVLAYVCAVSVSKFKISINSSEKIYDLILVNKDYTLFELFLEIEKILNNFNKNT